MDWAGWATFGLAATVALTGVLSVAQLAGVSRMDMPLLLGTVFTADPDRARLVGFAVHLVNGQVFALFYAATFALLDRAGLLLGVLLGLFHGLVALTVILPLVPALNPRVASDVSGPEAGPVLEPPGALGLNYGRQTPLVTLAAHLAYGGALGLLLHPR